MSTPAECRSALSSFDDRVLRLVRSWPGSLQDGLVSYQKGLIAEHHGRQRQPYWVLVPRWLYKRYSGRTRGKKPARPVLSNILWAQYCLYLFGRILDDDMDKHLHSRALRTASARFEEEARRVFRELLGESGPFWKTYRRCVYGAKESFYRVDQLQRQRSTSPATLLGEYARVSAIFQVAPAGICTLFCTPRDFPKISAAMHELSMFGQILDDLDDLAADLDDRRLNYVARRLLLKKLNSSSAPTDISRKLVNAFCFTDTIPRLFDELKDHLDGARKAAAPLRLPEFGRLLDTYKKNLITHYAHIERQRASAFFERVLAATAQ